eukprot:TRINITY_DN6222_c0_g1_i3.p1 TRINITY_DN6222_c0_g1~~TRINITY_DN6222_c0_g1_i3.p1  ORF type:complete len:247 (+),score=-36.02 TRINITY_DN6222_c0_g1_i3:429-1169(+)
MTTFRILQSISSITLIGNKKILYLYILFNILASQFLFYTIIFILYVTKSHIIGYNIQQYFKKFKYYPFKTNNLDTQTDNRTTFLFQMTTFRILQTISIFFPYFFIKKNERYYIYIISSTYQHRNYLFFFKLCIQISYYQVIQMNQVKPFKNNIIIRIFHFLYYLAWLINSQEIHFRPRLEYSNLFLALLLLEIKRYCIYIFSYASYQSTKSNQKTKNEAHEHQPYKPNQIKKICVYSALPNKKQRQ